MEQPRDDEPVEETVHFANGRVKYRGFMLGGVMHGAWSWYRIDGSLMRTGEFDQGRQVREVANLRSRGQRRQRDVVSRLIIARRPRASTGAVL